MAAAWRWRWVRLDLILTMRSHIYINFSLNPLSKFTSSSRSTRFKGIFLWNIPQMITKTILISTMIAIRYAMKQGITFWIWQKVHGNWDSNMIRISQWRESHCRIIFFFYLNKVIWNYDRVNQSISSTRIG